VVNTAEKRRRKPETVSMSYYIIIDLHQTKLTDVKPALILEKQGWWMVMKRKIAAFSLCMMLLCLGTAAADDRYPVGLAVFHNVLPGFGYGSLMQKDYPAAAILLTTEVGASLMLVGGIISIAFAPPSPGSIVIGDQLIILAFCVYGGAKVLGLLFPLLNEAINRIKPAAASAGETVSITAYPQLALTADRRASVGLRLRVALP
jgi:hypothetical protein